MSTIRSIVDLGSNSVRVRIARRLRSGKFVTVAEDREMVRLGRSILSSGRIDSKARLETLNSVRRFAALIDRHGSEPPLVFATAALRDAKNGVQVALQIQKILDVPVRILSGREEGEFLLRGARAKYNMEQGARAVADLGGGSLQFVRTIRGIACENASMPIGVLRLCERFGTSRFPDARFLRMRNYVRDVLASRLLTPREPCDFFAGAGGAFAACEAIARARGVQGPIPLEEVQRQIRKIRGMSSEARKDVPGLDPKRVDMIVPALCVVSELMRHVNAPSFVNFGDGVRDGMLIEAFDGPEVGTVDALSAAHRLLNRVPSERAHSTHVHRLAVTILEQLCEFASHRFGGLRRHKTILEIAALLHDIGVPVDYSLHQIWSSRIVKGEWLGSISESDRIAVASLVQHHRKTDLSVESARDCGVSATMAGQLVKLSFILRAADALDRSHRGRVKSVTIQRTRDRAACIGIDAKGDVNRELKALWKKGDGLLGLLGSKIRVSIR